MAGRYLTTRQWTKKDEVIFLEENDGGWGGEAVIFANEAGGLTVAVAEEMAVDSNNEWFECKRELSKEEAERLRDYLNEYFPK